MHRAIVSLRACAAVLFAQGLLAAPPAAAGERIEEIVVTARLLPKPQQAVAASVSVLPAQLIRDRQARHVEELLNAAPNVNYSAGASRGRFVQIRGIGERSQFVDPVDPSVGLYIDGIDFSGLGNAGTLFDVEQVEVLRGPQGTAFGASALAGLVDIRSAAPTSEPLTRLEAGVADYGGSTLGAVASGSLSPELRGRLALHRNRSDGYVENDYLDRDDTNRIDEDTLRARLDWQASETLEIGVTALGVDADNGYDAWSLDNDRHTLSDRPGRDSQRSAAAALRAQWSGASAFDVQALATWMDTDTDYGYDEDWSYPGLCDGRDCEGWEYASTDRYRRAADARSMDLRLVGRPAAPGWVAGWVAGVHVIRRDTGLDREFHDWDLDAPGRFHSDYRSGHAAAYGELEWAASERLTLNAGVRVQRFEARYRDSLGLRERPADWLRGGQLSAQYDLGEGSMLYALFARGYKAGGVNGEAIGKARKAQLDPQLLAFLAARSAYDAELLDNYEIGWKYARPDGRLNLTASLFYMDRRDVQLKAWYVEGQQFVGYTDNAASGENYGFESTLAWAASGRLRIDASLGLLETRIDGFVANDPERGFVDRSGRAQAQAPGWQFRAGAEFALLPRVYLRLEYEGKDAYYLSDSDDQKSAAFRLLHLGAGWRGEQLDVAAWVRNALDEDYAVHGFHFGNDPRKFYAAEPYWQFGAPRVAGVTLSWRFE
ncbi:MAG: Vitamin B12 transporter BtuB [Pseudomonadales bacterium]|nr:Vitamin B12 transporter BtuB [Pseudomonadales bacterium]